MIRLIFLGLLVALAAGSWEDNGEVCFGAKNEQSGKFNLKSGGKLSGIEITHTAGFVSCVRLQPGRIYPTRWGCQYRTNAISMIISNKQRGVLFPNSYNTKFHGSFQETGGLRPNSSVVAFSNFMNPARVAAGEEIRVWYGEDYFNSTEGDNQGTTCGNVRTYVEALHKHRTYVETIA